MFINNRSAKRPVMTTSSSAQGDTYIYVHCTRGHTHTHIYIYIYINIFIHQYQECQKACDDNFLKCTRGVGAKDYSGYVFYPFEPTKMDPERCTYIHTHTQIQTLCQYTHIYICVYTHIFTYTYSIIS